MNERDNVVSLDEERMLRRQHAPVRPDRPSIVIDGVSFTVSGCRSVTTNMSLHGFGRNALRSCGGPPSPPA